MSTRTKKLLKQLNKDLKEKVFPEIAAKYDIESDRVIEDPNEFSNLGFVNQDIIDTGRLLRSKIIVPKGDLEIQFSWNPVNPDNGYEYASAVWWGFSAWGKKFIPGRPWSDRAMHNIDPVNGIAKHLQNLGYDAKVVRDDTRSIGKP